MIVFEEPKTEDEYVDMSSPINGGYLDMAGPGRPVDGIVIV